jgi:DNA-binding response OmpR family regulator
MRCAPLQRIVGEPVRVLVIEDEAPLRSQIAENLRNCGFEPTEAPDHGSAVARLRERWHDAIVWDLKTPLDGPDGETNGNIVLREVSQCDRKPVFMFLTEGVARQSIPVKLGAIAYFDKKTDLEQLSERVGELWMRRGVESLYRRPPEA